MLGPLGALKGTLVPEASCSWCGQQRWDLILLHTPRHATAAAWVVVALGYRCTSCYMCAKQRYALAVRTAVSGVVLTEAEVAAWHPGAPYQT
jgi:hypothetical protein